MTSQVTIVVPVFNEQEIIEDRARSLINDLEGEFDRFQVILSENGSTDRTKDLVRELDSRFPQVTGLVDDDCADYGQALISGIERADYDEVSILELDYLDLGFFRESYRLLDQYDLIIGSKKISPGIDQRPFKRRFFTAGYNVLLQLLFRTPITETHGLKTLRRSKLLPISEQCVTRHAVYPTELVIRSWQSADVRVKEIPLTMPLVEVRTTRIAAGKRLRKTLSDLNRLRCALKESPVVEIT